MADEHRQWHEGSWEGGGSEPRLEGRARAPRDSVGRLLRQAREHHGHDLPTVAQILRIRLAYLEAIEAGRFDELPGATYAVGFVRSYANYLDLDEQEVVRRFKEEVAGIDNAQELHFPKPVNEGKVPGGAVLLVSLVLIAAAYGGWYYMTSHGRSVSDLVPAVPDRLKELVGDEEPTSVAEGEVEGAGPELETPATGEARVATRADPAQPAAESEPGEGAGPSAARPESAPSSETSPDAAVGASGGAAEPPSAETENAPSGAGATATAEIETEAEAEADEALPAVPRIEGEDEPAPAPATSQTVTRDRGDATEAQAAPATEPVADTGRAESPATVPEPSTDTDPPTGATTAEAGGASGTRAESGEEGPPAIPEIDAPAAASESGDEIVAGASSPQVAVLEQAERVFGGNNADSRVLLRALQDSWVQVRGPGDSLLLTRVLHPGDVYRVPNETGLVLHTGNAGGLEVLVDGQSTGSLGDNGEVRRNISLDPEKLR